jgi:hypothetical protein
MECGPGIFFAREGLEFKRANEEPVSERRPFIYRPSALGQPSEPACNPYIASAAL